MKYTLWKYRRGEGPDAIKNANLFIGNLPLSWKEADLEKAFNQHGKVIKCKVLIDQLTGISRGCGFVLYSKTAEAETAIKGTVLFLCNCTTSCHLP